MTDEDPVLRGFAEDPPQSELFTDAIERAKLPHNDIGNAERLRLVHGAEMLWCMGVGWLVWNGRIWERERGALAALARAGGLQKLLEAEATAISRRPVPQAQIDAMVAETGCKPEDAEKKVRAGRRAAKMSFAKASGNAGKMKSALDLLAPSVACRVDDLDAEPWWITARNGELDLRSLGEEPPEAEMDEERADRLTAALKPFERAHRATRMMGCAYDPAATCPDWESFIDLALPDPEMRDFAQRVAGYLLYGKNDAQVCVINLGPGGNGKSTFVNGLCHVLGDYAAPCRIEMFLEAKTASTGPTPEEAILPGARALPASEPEMGATISTSKVKGLTGGERRQARALHKEPFFFTPDGVPILSFNRMPRATDDSEGFWRRILFIPWSQSLHTLPKSQQRTGAEMEAIVRREAPGILNWMLRGWTSYRARGLAPPDAVMQLKARQRAVADPVGEFLSDCTIRTNGARIQSSHLHAIYALWCEDNGAQALSMPRFKKLMIDKDFSSTKTGGRMMWVGIDWVDAPEVRALQDRMAEAEWRASGGAP